MNVSTVCVGEHVGLEEIADGLWNVYGPLRLGRLNERRMRIEDTYGELYMVAHCRSAVMSVCSR